ncbi:cupredoxin domain-containing protein [Fervidibacillus halotolerans]|uniref:Cupredoxin domain-containing protein n=1 Tax=Fervidibacillus halotolerans TaxID=2980027 RepID=A0A9E8M180_9BACI|nr:cupredoxin domain-containing protein [Fervidibacillus halotolerans]WAA13311.1 cupredoxin domain-containing protein [Fervidibacillus halotolerans]
MNFVVIRGGWIIKIVLLLLFFISIYIWYSFQWKTLPTFLSAEKESIREIHMVTGEFKTVTADGKEIESYRFSPGTIFLEKGETVHLKIYGVNGDEHPVIIEGTDIKATVKKGEETIIPLQFEEEGTYRLICLTHKEYEQNGPMIAYIVVD